MRLEMRRRAVSVQQGAELAVRVAQWTPVASHAMRSRSVNHTTTPDPVDQVRELVAPFVTTIHLADRTPPWQVWHAVRHEALIDQLEHSVTQTSNTAGEVYRASFGSKPAGRLDALSVLNDMDTETSQILWHLGMPHTGSLKTRVSGLGAVCALGDHPAVERAVHSWWARARVYTQLDGPAYSPNALCPTVGCFERGTIRVRLAERVATCRGCASVWTDATDPSFTQLAEWVSWSTEHLVTGHVCVECGPTHEAVRETKKKVSS